MIKFKNQHIAWAVSTTFMTTLYQDSDSTKSHISELNKSTKAIIEMPQET